MSGTQEIKDALAGGSMTFAELHAKLGGDRKKLSKTLSNMTSRRLIRSMGRGDERSIALASGAKKAVKGKRAKGKPKRKGKARARTFRDLANKGARASEAPGLFVTDRAARLTAHARTTFATLKAAIDLDGLEKLGHAVLSSAFRSHEQALDLLAP